MGYTITHEKWGEQSCVSVCSPVEGPPVEGSNEKLVRVVASAEGKRWLGAREGRETDFFFFVYPF